MESTSPTSARAARKRQLLPGLLAISIVVAVAVGGCGASSDGGSSSTNTKSKTPTAAAQKAKPKVGGPSTVNIKDYKYLPATLDVSAGTKVKFVNDDAANHTVTGKTFKLGNLAQGGGKASYTFKKAGTYKYICDYHPFMHGTVVVK